MRQNFCLKATQKVKIVNGRIWALVGYNALLTKIFTLLNAFILFKIILKCHFFNRMLNMRLKDKVPNISLKMSYRHFLIQSPLLRGEIQMIPESVNKK